MKWNGMNELNDMNEMNEKKNKGLFNKRSDSFGKGLGFELGNCFWKRPTFLLLAPGSALEKSLLQFWNLRTNLLKWTGPSHGPVPWEFVEKLFLNKGL